MFPYPSKHDPYINRARYTSTVYRIISGCPKPEQCSLYFVNRDVLFRFVLVPTYNHKTVSVFYN